MWLLAQPRGEARLWLALATVAVVLLQHAINLFNDAADWRLGADTEKFDSWVRVHGGNLRVTRLHGLMSLLAGGVLGVLVLLAIGQLRVLWLVAPIAALGFLYNTGPKPLSYTLLGEWVTGLCYGPGVVGGLWLVCGRSIDIIALLAMLAFAALASALLLSHQPPQIDTDRRAGKHTFAVRYGATRTRNTARILHLVFILCFGLALALGNSSAPVLVCFCLGGGYALAQSFIHDPAPPRILLPVTAILLATSATELVAASPPWQP